MLRCIQVKWILNKKREELPRSRCFDGIAVDDSAERPEIPRHFAVCTACHDSEIALQQGGQPSRLPQRVTLADLEQAPCDPTGALMPDKARPLPALIAMRADWRCPRLRAATSCLCMCAKQL